MVCPMRISVAVMPGWSSARAGAARADTTTYSPAAAIALRIDTSLLGRAESGCFVRSIAFPRFLRRLSNYSAASGRPMEMGAVLARQIEVLTNACSQALGLRRRLPAHRFELLPFRIDVSIGGERLKYLSERVCDFVFEFAVRKNVWLVPDDSFDHPFSYGERIHPGFQRRTPGPQRAAPRVGQNE